MAHSASTIASCLSIFSTLSRYKSIAAQSSTNLSTAIIPKLAAASLIASSAGLGAHYAWTTGVHHGPVLALLLVLMAVGLELAKPFSIAATFEAFRSWRLAQGVSLALLGLVAVAYSLTAELSLMATSRGDVIAERTAESGSAIKANEKYDRAKLELLTLEISRPKTELDEKIASLLMTPGADGCKEINGRVTREVCPRVAELKVDAARAERREQLEATMQEAEREAAKAPVAKVADPGAAALAIYLAIIGIVVDPKLLSNLLILVGVVALEAGSALSLVLVRAVCPVAVIRAVHHVNRPAVQPEVPQAVDRVVHPIDTGVPADPETARDAVKKRVLTHLKKSGGKASGSQRGLAKIIGADKTTMRRAIYGLVSAGVLAMEASKNGTMLRLVT